MDSINLIRTNLTTSEERVLLRIEDMRGHALVPSTPNGGPHTLWTLGHLAYIEALVIHTFMLGQPNPLAHWEQRFDGAEISNNLGDFPTFDEVLDTCCKMRASTRDRLIAFTETDLDTQSAHIPNGYEDTFGTYRHCFQYLADHWYMHRGQLADARRAAGLNRMWF